LGCVRRGRQLGVEDKISTGDDLVLLDSPEGLAVLSSMQGEVVGHNHKKATSGVRVGYRRTSGALALRHAGCYASAPAGLNKPVIARKRTVAAMDD
jgi:hypothetical protein